MLKREKGRLQRFERQITDILASDSEFAQANSLMIVRRIEPEKMKSLCMHTWFSHFSVPLPKLKYKLHLGVNK